MPVEIDRQQQRRPLLPRIDPKILHPEYFALHAADPNFLQKLRIAFSQLGFTANGLNFCDPQLKVGHISAPKLTTGVCGVQSTVSGCETRIRFRVSKRVSECSSAIPGDDGTAVQVMKFKLQLDWTIGYLELYLW